jgi:hypothetical protein
MTRTTKILLLLSLTFFLVGLTGVRGAIGLPLGAICLGLSMISKVMEKEAARFDEEQHSRLDHARQNQPPANPRTTDRAAENRRGKPSLEAHLPAR